MDAQSGTVISTSSTCTLVPSFAIAKDEQDTSSTTRFIELDCPPIFDVDSYDLAYYQDWVEGDFIIYRDWLGTIKSVDEEITVEIDGGGIVVIQDVDEIDERIPSPALPDFVHTTRGGRSQRNREVLIPASPCRYGQKIRVPRQVLSRGLWIVGSYKRRMKPVGVVINVTCIGVEVDWKVSKVGESRFDTSMKPARNLLLNGPETGAVKLYDPSRYPKRATGVEARHLAIHPPFVSADEDAKFKNIQAAESKYGWSLARQRQRKALSLSVVESAFKESIVAHIATTTSRVKVRWQDNSVTDEYAYSICPYDEVDEHDVWPGELVSRKDQEYSYHDPSYEGLIRTRAVGVVQSVNAVERIALVRWFEGADITITGENHERCVKPLSTLGRITDDVTEISVYEIVAHQAITRRRGDMVCIMPSYAPEPTTSSGNTQQASSNGFVQGDDEWYGEVVDLLLDGQVLVRLGGLENVRDVACSVLNLAVAASADDDTTESSTDSLASYLSDYSTDEDDLLISPRNPQQAVASMTVDYEGPAPSDPGSDAEDQWKTDSDSGIQSETEDANPQEPQTETTNTSNTSSKVDTSYPAELSLPDGSDEVCTDTRTEGAAPPITDIGPAAFDVLEGPAPEHTFGATVDGHSGKWLKSVLREHQILRSSLPEAVYVRTWESSLELIRVLIVGPSGTPYALAPFVFDIHLSKQFPYQAPSAFFHSWTNGIGKVNPNLYEDGKVCLSLLGTWFSEKDDEEWVPFKSSILQIIVSLLGLVLVKEPFYSKLALNQSGCCKFAKSTTRHFRAPALTCWPSLLHPIEVMRS